MSPATDVACVPGYTPIRFWSQPNQAFYGRFRRWLRDGGYSPQTITAYGIAARLTFGLLDKPYWLIKPESDLDRIATLIDTHYASSTTAAMYKKGLSKLADFLNQRQGHKTTTKSINWSTYFAGLPEWLCAALRRYVRQRQRAWLAEVQYERSLSLLSPLTQFLRWVCQKQPLVDLTDLTPSLWFAYLDKRLAAGRKPATVNGELAEVQAFVRTMAEGQHPICERLLAVEPLPKPAYHPKDVPTEQLRRLWAEIEADAASEHVGVRRMGMMDKAWVLLMLHSGLRTGEVRRLRQADVDLSGQRLRIEQSKGLKDRLVYLSQPTVAAIEAYLPLRGPLESDHLFVYRHRPLSIDYCKVRLQTYGRRCDVRITPHQLRHSCATMLLNAGAPVLTVQAIMGHKWVDTTMTYARLYDRTVAADFYRAMVGVEQRLQLATDQPQTPLTPAQLAAIADALADGTLNDGQRQLLHTLRTGLLALADERKAG